MIETFIGREREVALLSAGLQDALGGRGSVFLVSGEPGIGKTALAEHVADRAADQDTRVVWSRSWDGGGAAPYWSWTQIIRALVEGLDEDALGSILSTETAPIAMLVPELTERFGEAAESSPVPDSTAGRFYLFEAVARFLKGASSLQPLVVILDDLLAGDRPSLLLLRFVAKDVRASRLMLVATYRDAEATRSPEVLEVLGDLVREGSALGLRGLSREDVGRLIAHTAGVEPWEGKVAAIAEATAGNPLFVREVTRLLAGEDRLDRPGRLTIPVPDSVRAVIRRRLAPLSAEGLQLLSAAAVVGRDFDVTLAAAASDLPTEHVLGSLSEAEALGVVAPVPETVGTYRFSHPLMREAIYTGLPLPARMQMHGRVGEAIERLYGPDSTSHLGELAHHFSQVAAAGQSAKAMEYARRAGDQAMDSCAYEAAAAQYQRAVETLRFAELDERHRCELLLRLGNAQARAGEYGEAKRSFRRAAEIARRTGAPGHLAQAALGFGEPQVEGGLVDQQLLSLLQEALDALPSDDSALRARVLARFSLELTFSDETALQESLSREALEMARRLGDVTALAVARRARWMAVWGPDGLEERSALSDEILGLARRTVDPEMELLGRARRITCSMEAGDIRAADAHIAAHGRLAEELRMPYHEWTAATLRAGRALMDGSLEEAEKLADEALSLLPGRPNAPLANLNQLTPIRWEQGRIGELRGAWEELTERFPQAAFGGGWISLANADGGREDDARRDLLSLVDDISEMSRDGLWLSSIATAALAASRLDERDAAARLYPLLLPYAERTIVIPMPHPVMSFGSASLYLGLLATVTTRWDEAADHYESALRANTRLGARAFLARTQYEYGRMLVRRGQAADRGRTRELLDRAEANARACGMTALLESCERLRALEVGESLEMKEAEVPALPEAGKSVFRAEGDYWTVVYEGSLVRLRDSKGLRHLARMLAEPGREFHVVDLEAAESPRPRSASTGPAEAARTDSLETRFDLGDAGEALDAEAKAAYKARLEELEEELDDAESWGDPERAAKAREERDFLARELARAVGLGGRDRRAASHAERARLNSTRAIRAAMDNLARANPALGHHLSSTIRTGRYCSYNPDPRAPIVWES